MERQVEIKNITKKFGDLIAVNHADLHVNKGETIALLGPSGCGKTTTLRSVSGLEEIDEGEIYISGESVAAPNENIHVPPYERSVGMMFQSNALWPHMSVFENISFPLRQKGFKTDEEIEDRVDDLLNMVGLSRYKETDVNNLSGGQQQRVALARSLSHDPDVLLMDEPLSSLDARLQRQMRTELRSIQQQQGFTTIYVTHDQKEAMYMADQIYLMNDGEIVESNTPENIYREPSEEFTMEFFDPNEPLVAEVIGSDENGLTTFKIKGSESPSIKARVNDNPMSRGDEYSLYIRPHDIEVVDGVNNKDNIIHCKVVMSAFQGSGYELGLKIGESTILCEVDENIEVGEQVSIYLDPDTIQIFKRVMNA